MKTQKKTSKTDRLNDLFFKITSTKSPNPLKPTQSLQFQPYKKHKAEIEALNENLKNTKKKHKISKEFIVRYRERSKDSAKPKNQKILNLVVSPSESDKKKRNESIEELTREILKINRKNSVEDSSGEFSNRRISGVRKSIHYLSGDIAESQILVSPESFKFYRGAQESHKVRKVFKQGSERSLKPENVLKRYTQTCSNKIRKLKATLESMLI